MLWRDRTTSSEGGDGDLLDLTFRVRSIPR